MKTIFCFTLFIFCFGLPIACVWGQEGTQSLGDLARKERERRNQQSGRTGTVTNENIGDPKNPAQAQQDAPKDHNMTGCLQKGADAGTFRLTDLEEGPKAVEIVESTVDLNTHVGQTVQITGSVVPGKDPKAHTMKVWGIAWLSPTCSNKSIGTPTTTQEAKTKEKGKVGTGVAGGAITTTKETEKGYQEDRGGVKVGLSYKGNVTETVDCGNEGCFQQKFAACQPATFGTNVEGFAGVQNKIIGPAAGGCKVTFKYTKNPNPNWVNKEMTCAYDNKVDFFKAQEKAFNGVLDGSVVCEGPLYPIFRNQ